MKKIFTTISIVLSSFLVSSAQVVWTYPLFPTVNDAITLYYDASQGNGALAGFTGDIYIHTGVITNLSTSGTDWKYVVTTWGTTDAAWKLTSLGNDLYSYSIPGITSFYGVPGTETVLQLAMVFRNGDGSIVGRDAGGTDIYYDVWDGTSLQTKFLSPSASPYFVDLNDPVNTIFITSILSTVTLYEDGNFVTQFTNTDSINYTFNADSYGTTWIKVVANDGSSEVADSFYYVVNPPVVIADLPAGTVDGINYINDSTVTLVLVAPDKQFVYAIGDFTNWVIDDQAYMNKTPDGTRWWVTLNNLIPMQEYRYQFMVDGNLSVADPYADKVLDPWNDQYIPDATYPGLIDYPTGNVSGIVSVLQTGQPDYNWQVTSFTKPDPNSMVVYELLIRDFIAARNFQTLLDTLSYLKTLGVTAIELMPFSEFEGNESWGYNPSFYFAPDKYYGTKDAVKAFIDACHQDGIAVIQDMVLNHSFSQSPMCQLYWDSGNFWPTADNPWYNTDQNPGKPGYQGKHPFGVGYDFNHESTYTQKFMDDVLKYWVTEYKIDGFRFDLSKGFTQTYSGDDVGFWGQYDQSRIDILKRMADQVRDVDPSVILILEHFADNSEEEVLSDYDFYPWGNLAYAYNQSAMGYSSGSDIGWINYKSRGWDDPHVVGYMESHDEERMMYKTITFGNSNTTYSVKPLDSALNRMKLSALHFILIPGPKMIWQFGELGYDYSLTFGGSNISPKPIKWDYFQYGPRKWLYYFYAALNNFKRDYTVSKTTDFFLSGNGLKKGLKLNSTDMNVNIFGNFEIIDAYLLPAFQHTGWWYEYFTGDSINVTDVNASVFLKAGEYHMYTDEKLQQPELGNVGIDDIEGEGKLFLQNFPNPFSEVSTIDFYLPQNGNTSLQVLDINGRMMRTITDKFFTKGWYTVDISAGDLTPGVYFCLLKTESETRSVKMVIE